ncbi:MAG: metallophosphoesterase [Mangrovibacterium sp.]
MNVGEIVLQVKTRFAILGCLCVFLWVSCLGESAQKPDGLRIAVMADVHFQNVYGEFSGGNFKGIENPGNGKYATIRTMEAQLHSTRLFNENYFAFLAALDDAVNRQVRLIILPGDLTDDGQPFNGYALKTVLENYSEKFGVTFLAINGNHDAVRPFEMDAGKADYLGAEGRPQPVMSRDGIYGRKNPEGLPVSVSPDMKSMGYPEMAETLGPFGLMPQQKYLYWETPFSDCDVSGYSFSKASDASSLESRQCLIGPDSLSLSDISYLVEPVDGLWLLAIDANVYVPNGNAKSDPADPANYSGPGDGYNLVLKHKKYLIGWVRSVSQRAAKLNKTLLVFSHYPMVDFYDGAAGKLKSVFGGKAPSGRLPEEEVARAFADAGVKVHFGGHMHMNDTGIKTTAKGNTLVNIQVPSLSAYIPAYKLLTIYGGKLDVETVVMDSVPRFNELFPLYEMEYAYLKKTGQKDIWDRNILSAGNYRDYAGWHLRELVRLRFLPNEWPDSLASFLTGMSGKELLLMACKNSSAEADETFREAAKLARQKGIDLNGFESWNGLDLIVDFYRISLADRLAVEDIGDRRLGQYELIFEQFARQNDNGDPICKQVKAFAESFRLLLNGDPAGSFTVDIKNGGIVNDSPAPAFPKSQ